jgi:hypothetical protein
MNKLIAGLGFFALTTLAIVPTASASTTYSFGNGMGSQAFGTCNAYRTYWQYDVVHQHGPFTLPSGTYRPLMGTSTVWQIKKANTTDQSIPFMGELRLEVVEIAIFGAETVRSSYVRSFDSSGMYAGGAADNREFGSFVVAANNTSQFVVRVTASAGPCSVAYMKDVRLELTKE